MSSLTFGPKWVRDLSSGDNNAAAPPNTPPPRKYKLAEFRYGREEMLALLSDNYDFPLGLKEFEDIINKRPVQPLAFVPVSEEEERCHMGGVNSALVLKLTGRGAPVLRGRGAVRGRGRGRAADYPLHRSSSTSEDSSYPQKPWPEIQQRGGYHRPVGRGESFDALPARVGYEPTRSRISSDGTPSPRSGEYWRSNSTESPASVEDPGSPGQENGGDGWRQSGTKLPVTKPVVNKKGFADNARNWRDVKEQQQQTNSEQSPHTNSKTWPRSSSHEKEGNSNLPEWCNDDSFDDAVPGSFDSSGQYRSFKEQEKEVSDNDTSETTVIQEKISLKNGNSKSSSPIAVSNTESPTNVPILSVSVDTLPTEKSSDPPEVNLASSLNVDIAIKNISNEVGTTKDVPNKEVKKDDKTKESIIHKEVKVSIKTDESTQNFQQINANLPSSREDPVTQDADFEFSLDHIKDMVENLDYESEEEDKSYQDNFKTHSAVNDPSIVYAKKAEPGKAINGMQDWIYRDPQGEVQGPFSNDEMLEWFKAGYFTMGLLVRRICDEAFLPLEYVIKLWGRIPFTLKNQPPPITNQMLQAYRQHEQAQMLRLQHLQQQQQKQKIAQRQQQQQLQQRQQQQQMTQTLLKHLHIESRPQDSGIQDLSVWGDNSTNHSPNTGSTPWVPGLDNETNVWNVKPEALTLRDVEAEQNKQAMLERQSTTQIEQFNGDLQQPNSGNKDNENENEKTVQEKNETKKNNKSNKKKYKEKAEEQEIRRQVEAEQRQKERDEAQRKALEALKHQQQLQQQQKNAEQKRLIEEQSRRDEIIRTKQQQQQMHQQMLLQKYQQEHQQKHQVSPNPIWQMTPTSSAPSLAEIQRAQERKEAEVHEHMKVIHQHDQIVQQQRAQARWAQQQGFQSQHKQNHHQVKPLVEIQAEEAQKVLQQQQQRQHLQQQQVNHGFNQLPWNSSGQPLVGKSTKSNNAIFWDDVIGIPSVSRPNGNSSIQQQVQYQGVHQQRKGYNDFPPFQSGNKTSKKENRDQEIVNRIFQAPTPSSDFINWVERNLPAVKKAIDVPTVVSFLQDIESPYEVHDYMRSYLGDSNEQKEFVREFLERRKKAGQQQKQRSPAVSLQLTQSQNNNEEQADTDEKKSKKKKKMQKVDPNLLGFQCNAAPDVLNRVGEIESVAYTAAKMKK